MFRFSDMTPNELRNYQLKLSDMLEEIDAICKKNNLTYFLTFGSCLGAIRHNGFIPWDDDLDIALPRKDYEKLFLIWDNRTSKNILVRPQKGKLTGFHIMSLRNPSTTCIYQFGDTLDTCHGIKIDIAPLDGCPNNKLLRIKQKIDGSLYGLFTAQRIPNHTSKAKKSIAKLLLLILKNDETRYRMWKAAEKGMMKYSYDDSEYVFSTRGVCIKREVYGTPKLVEFEGKMRPIPEKYDEYLKIKYGDYMKLPSIQSRKSTTEVLFYDLNNSYKDYKGKYYLVDNKG